MVIPAANTGKDNNSNTAVIGLLKQIMEYNSYAYPVHEC